MTLKAVERTAAPAIGLHVCPQCGAVESLSVLIAQMVQDDEITLMLGDMLRHSIPLGGFVARYLDLHVPPKQRIRPEAVRALLAELVPDIRRWRITARGREWQAPESVWFAAFSALFWQAEAGTLTLPLKGNAYLYSVIVNKANDAETAAERAAQAAQQHRTGPRSAEPIHPAHALATPAPAAPASATGQPDPARAAELRARFNRPAAAPGNTQGD